VKLDLTVPWMVPSSAAAKKVRPAATLAVKGMPSFINVLKNSAQHKHELESRLLKRQRIAVGWLSNDPLKGWHCRYGVLLPGGDTLAIVYPGADAEIVWKPIGKVANGVASIDTRDVDVLVEGRVVFACQGMPR